MGGVEAFGAEFVVPFDPAALDRQRLTLRRRVTIAAVGWVILIPITAVLVWIAGSAGAGILVVPWLVLLVSMIYLAVVLCLALARSVHWAEGRLPARAMLLTNDQLWVSTPATYPWESVRGLEVRKVQGRTLLVVDLAPDSRPDLPVTLGLEEIDHAAGIRRRLGWRGPRFVPATLGIPLADLDAAVRHFSGGRVAVTA